jgi:hypothetical protein
MVDIHAERHVCRFSYEMLTAAHGGLLGCDVMQTGRSQCFRGTIDIDRKNQRSWETTCPSATLSTHMDLGANLCLHGDRPVTKCLSHGTANPILTGPTNAPHLKFKWPPPLMVRIKIYKGGGWPSTTFSSQKVQVKLACFCHAGTKGKRKCSAYSFLTSALDGSEQSASCPSCPLPLGKDHRYPLDRKLGGPQSWSGYKRIEEKSFASARGQNLVIQSVVTHYTS